MSTQDGGTPSEADGVPLSVRAQLLATEHWSLLASRSTTQGEVLTRISMFLMFTSASLVSLALVGQATRFSDMFLLLAALVLFVDVVIGLLTQIRVLNVAQEDLMYVLAMNRLRAAYLELDPGTSWRPRTTICWVPYRGTIFWENAARRAMWREAAWSSSIQPTPRSSPFCRAC